MTIQFRNPEEIPFEELPQWAREPRENPEDQASIFVLLLRDLVVGGGLLWAWLTCNRLFPEVEGIALSMGAGVLSFIAAFFIMRLIHEWGHLIPARCMGTLSPVKSFKSITWLFDYDFMGATKLAFFISSIGASILHWAFFAIMILTVPGDSPLQVGFLCGLMFFGIAGSAVEVPMILRSFTGISAYHNWEIHFEHGDRNKRLSALLALIGTLAFYFLYF